MPCSLPRSERATQAALRLALAVALAVGAFVATPHRPGAAAPMTGAAVVSTAFPIAQAQFARPHALAAVARIGS